MCLDASLLELSKVLLYKWEGYCRTNGRRTALQMGGALLGFPSRLRREEGTAMQMGGVLPYKLEVYCSTFSENGRGWGF